MAPAFDYNDMSSASGLKFCLKWNKHDANLISVFDKLLQSESFVDVTLACDGRSLKAHKMVLSANSPYFEELFLSNPCQHPIILMKDFEWEDLKAAVEFMYKGSIQVSHEQIESLLKIANSLKIRGLIDSEDDVESVPSSSNESAHCDDDSKINDTHDIVKDIIVRKRSQGSTERIADDLSVSKRKKILPFSPARPVSSPASPAETKPTVLASVTKQQPTAIKLEEYPILKLPSHVKTFHSGDKDAKISDKKPKAQDLTGPNTPHNVSALPKLKSPLWTQDQLHGAIQAVVSQKMRFSVASTSFGIPKGTLYDNILGKTKRMLVLDEVGLSNSEEKSVLEFSCDLSNHPYQKHTSKSLVSILNFVQILRRNRDPDFEFTGVAGFRWWWAFCKKHSIVSRYNEGSSAT